MRNGLIVVAPCILFSLTPLATAASSWRDPVLGMEFIQVRGACFDMGTDSKVTTPTQRELEIRYGFHGDLAIDEKPRHEVCVDSFWMGRFEVRRDEWRTLMEGASWGASDLPATDISWHKARTFLDRFADRLGADVRLPTEAEWEFACRAGDAKDIPQSQQQVAGAWFATTMRSKTGVQAVGTRKPNALGFHDMLGNVWEWVEDAYDPRAYSTHSLFNPKVASGDAHVVRGGSFLSAGYEIRCGNRAFHRPSDSLPQIGFRVVIPRLPTPVGSR